MRISDVILEQLATRFCRRAAWARAARARRVYQAAIADAVIVLSRGGEGEVVTLRPTYQA